MSGRAYGHAACVTATEETPMPARARSHGGSRRVRYAVVGLGHIAQTAVLPAFEHARSKAELVALFSDDRDKLATLGRRYRVAHTFPYERYEEGLARAGAEAVYIALPNTLHREYTERAARCGLHVLCEKPLATRTEDCAAMITAARENGVKLMTAYRLHFDPATLKALEQAASGKLGELRAFSSAFTMQVKHGNSRLDRSLGGGPLLDVGIYCINAARKLFRGEPVRVVADCVGGGDPRFAEVPEMVSAQLRFPGGRLASFVCSFGAADASWYELLGTEGSLRMEPAYSHGDALVLSTRVGEKTKRKRFPRHDQFAGELLHFSTCVLEDRKIESDGLEGLLDVAVIEAVEESARRGEAVALSLPGKPYYPTKEQAKPTPPPRRAPTVNVSSPRE
jgi:glucose-fructose oxidoreductase